MSKRIVRNVAGVVVVVVVVVLHGHTIPSFKRSLHGPRGPVPWSRLDLPHEIPVSGRLQLLVRSNKATVEKN